jgi:hypothetical protein
MTKRTAAFLFPLAFLLAGLFWVFLPQNKHFFAVGVDCMPQVISNTPGESSKPAKQAAGSFLTDIRKYYFGTKCISW